MTKVTTVKGIIVADVFGQVSIECVSVHTWVSVGIDETLPLCNMVIINE